MSDNKKLDPEKLKQLQQLMAKNGMLPPGAMGAGALAQSEKKRKLSLRNVFLFLKEVVEILHFLLIYLLT